MLFQVSPLLDMFTKVNDMNLSLKDLYVSEAKCFKYSLLNRKMPCSKEQTSPWNFINLTSFNF